MDTFALNFSRPAGQIIAQYYNFLRLGREGYRRIQQACYDTAVYLGKEVSKLGPFKVIYDGKDGIPALLWQLKDDKEYNFNLFDLSDRLRTRGWQVPAYSLPANLEDTVVIRLMIRHGVSRDLGDLLIEDIKRSLEYFKKHKITTSMNEKEGGGFHH